jgi:cation:H+ antiporter
MVNNATNLTLLLALPALMGGLVLMRAKSKSKQRFKEKEDQLHLLFTLLAALFFVGVMWALGRDGTFNSGDGMVLIGVFIFWQCFHVYEVLKQQQRKNSGINLLIVFDLVLLLIAALGIYVSTERIVEWIAQADSAYISTDQMGLITGWLMVLPNALLALYYALRNRPDIVYSSQVGDCHICIPLCLGLYAVVQPMQLPADLFMTGCLLLAGTIVVHFVLVLFLGRLPAWAGVGLIGAYCFFIYQGWA